MPRKTFVNLPVKDLTRSVEFFKALGFEFNPQFTDEKATAMVISDEAFAMLLVEDFFTSISNRKICDTDVACEAIVCLSADSREEVDDLVARAVAAGGIAAGKVDDGPMYGGAFYDLDGHHWELIYLDPVALEGAAS